MQLSTNRLEGGRRTRGDVRSIQPLVSIVMVVRNNREDIEKAFASVFAQNKDRCELLVIDGVSTDGTLDIIEKYSRDIDYWMSEPDDGIYDAMNKGVKLALGKYVYFLGSDDLLTVDLNSLASVLTDPNTIYYGNALLPSGEIPLWNGPYNAWRWANRSICHQAMLYPIGAFQTECFNIEYKICGDYAFNLRCFSDKTLRFQYIPYVIAVYAETGLSSTVGDAAFDRDRIRLIRKYLPLYVYVFKQSKQLLKRFIRRT